MTPTLEELKAQELEIRNKMDAILTEQREIERKAKEAEQEEKRKVAIQKARETNSAHADAIIAELARAGYPDAVWNWRDEGVFSDMTRPVIHPHGKDEAWQKIRIQFGTTYGSGWNGREHTVIEVGYYPTTKYPLKKDGTFNYPAIAKKFREMEENEIARQKNLEDKETRRQKNFEVVKRIKKAFGMDDYSDAVSISQYSDYKVNLKITATLTEEEASKVLRAVIATGLWKPS